MDNLHLRYGEGSDQFWDNTYRELIPLLESSASLQKALAKGLPVGTNWSEVCHRLWGIVAARFHPPPPGQDPASGSRQDLEQQEQGQRDEGMQQTQGQPNAVKRGGQQGGTQREEKQGGRSGRKMGEEQNKGGGDAQHCTNDDTEAGLVDTGKDTTVSLDGASDTHSVVKPEATRSPAATVRQDKGQQVEGQRGERQRGEDREEAGRIRGEHDKGEVQTTSQQGKGQQEKDPAGTSRVEQGQGANREQNSSTAIPEEITDNTEHTHQGSEKTGTSSTKEQQHETGTTTTTPPQDDPENTDHTKKGPEDTGTGSVQEQQQEDDPEAAAGLCLALPAWDGAKPAKPPSPHKPPPPKPPDTELTSHKQKIRHLLETASVCDSPQQKGIVLLPVRQREGAWEVGLSAPLGTTHGEVTLQRYSSVFLLLTPWAGNAVLGKMDIRLLIHNRLPAGASVELVFSQGPGRLGLKDIYVRYDHLKSDELRWIDLEGLTDLQLLKKEAGDLWSANEIGDLLVQILRRGILWKGGLLDTENWLTM
ncbi:hypothetical protein CBR_g19469 [Chara braunii]|uniref:Uncharacterized protein n=1 Tax=Chara braunii TaxID=69332 RepID=A0A388KY14_CHABU|nr:hypothetical protein CBR_g19469 [Chara braunii]|eukprot:GBG74954.1 hypothetical protein CBR_g19469 [Chara braunii]